jgi:hypothetical protein
MIGSGGEYIKDRCWLGMASSVAKVIEVEYEGIKWTADNDIEIFKKLTNPDERRRFIEKLENEREIRCESNKNISFHNLHNCK